MKDNKLFWFAFLSCSVAVAILASCTPFVQPATSTPVPDSLYTQAAETIIADLTKLAPAHTPTLPPAFPTDTPVVPTSTPMPTATLPPSPTSTQPPTQAALPTATQLVGTLAYEDDFSTETGWVQQQNDSWSMGYAQGGYFIKVNITNAPVWSVRNQDFEDIRLEVDAYRSQGPVTGYYGLVCRHVNGDNYYALVVSDDGFYGIGLVEKGEKLRFLQEGIAPPDLLKPAGTPNRLRADCVGTTLSLYANGVKLAEIQDDTFDAGETGLLAGTRKEAGLQALFDNLVARSP